jgi:regulator of sigma E protease
LSSVIWILGAALALGLVIFVHELGHFVVAKLCGVKCEKFYLGFDIYGLKLCKFRRGETEYGIGILPLGGYVKMLGQEDNPAKLREEIERAKAAQSSSNAPDNGSTAASGGDATAEPAALQAAEAALYDPRSYLAKSVPQRMAIISAGVVMNVIFAFLAAVVAYAVGVKQIAPGVGATIPGRPAWQLGFRVGDHIEEIGGQPIEKFNDLRKRVTLGDNLADGVPIKLQRPGVDEPIELHITPTSSGLAPTIGVFSPRIATLLAAGPPAVRGTAAAKAQPPLEKGDRIVQVGDRPVNGFADVYRYLATHVDEPIVLTVERAVKPADDAKKPTGQPAPAVKRLAVTLPVNPMRSLGLEMELGPIRAIQAGSPAEGVLKVGDVLQKLDGQLIGDPLALSDRLRRRAGQPLTLTVAREGEPQPREVAIVPRAADWFDESLAEGSPLGIPQLGIACRVLNRIVGVAAGSPAAEAELKPGEFVVEAVFLPPEKSDDDPKEKTKNSDPKPIELSAARRNWPFFMAVLQFAPPGSQVKLKVNDGGDEEPREVTLTPQPVAGWNNPERGLQFEPEQFTQTAHSLRDALHLGGRETGEAMMMVVTFLRKLANQELSPRTLGGPVTILKEAGHAANRGLADWLIFITLLSANLAVLNFLPIPLLDGGHMVFLAYEGVRRKPADERVQLLLTYIGLALILGLMIWALGLDFGLISRDVPIPD